MSSHTGTSADTGAVEEKKESWVPMITIALTQILMSFNVASLPVALGGMVKSFNVPPTTIATGIVMYSLAVAAFVMLGAKLNQRFGSLVVFRIAVLVFGAAQVLMTFSPNATAMITAQALSGLAGAAMVPAPRGADRRELSGYPAGNGIGRARLGAGRCGCHCVSGRRGSWYVYRLAAGVRHSDCSVGHYSAA
jgi:MFS family permease